MTTLVSNDHVHLMSYTVSINGEFIDINELIEDLVNSLKKLNIDKNTDITLAKCIKIHGEVGKLVKGSKEIYSKLENISPAEKASSILTILLAALKSEKVKELLSDDQIKKIEEFSNDTETVETVIALVDWVSDHVLDSLDADDDGFITEEELERCATKCCLCKGHCGQDPKGCGCYQPEGCCSCCQSFVKIFSSCWSSFFLKILCCAGDKKKVKVDN